MDIAEEFEIPSVDPSCQRPLPTPLGPTIASRLEAIASTVEAIASRLEAIAIGLEAIAIRLEGCRHNRSWL